LTNKAPAQGSGIPSHNSTLAPTNSASRLDLSESVFLSGVRSPEISAADYDDAEMKKLTDEGKLRKVEVNWAQISDESSDEETEKHGLSYFTPRYHPGNPLSPLFSL